MGRVSDRDETTPAQPQPGKRARRDPEPPVAEEAAGQGGAPAGGAVVTEERPEGGSRPKRSVGRRITFWVGIGMIAAGLALLCYVAWQLWGTNWISKRNQREITTHLREDWGAGNGQRPEFVPTGEASALIRIPKFGKKYVVPVIEGTSQSVLAKGYGHFEETADPGEVGNYALAAHRVTHGEPLRDMPDLRPGDKVIVETVDMTYTYRLDTNPNDLVIPFTGIWVLDALPTNPDGGVQPEQKKGQRLITLTTCSELFHTDNRMIAFGHLVSKERKAGATAAG